MVLREEDADVVNRLLIFIMFIIPIAGFSQQEINDEIQVNINSYFDNFNVDVIYPNISVVKSIDDNTSLNGSYMVDAISSALPTTYWLKIQLMELLRQHRTKMEAVITLRMN